MQDQGHVWCITALIWAVASDRTQMYVVYDSKSSRASFINKHAVRFYDFRLNWIAYSTYHIFNHRIPQADCDIEMRTSDCHIISTSRLQRIVIPQGRLDLRLFAHTHILSPPLFTKNLMADSCSSCLYNWHSFLVDRRWLCSLAESWNLNNCDRLAKIYLITYIHFWLYR